MNFLANNFKIFREENQKTEKLKLKLRDKNISQVDLDYLLLHIENVTKSSISDYWLDSSCGVLNINFDKLIKSNVQFLPIQSQQYKHCMRAFDQDLFVIDTKRLIVKNINTNMDKYLTIFLKNLLLNIDSTNEIIQYYESKLFKHAYIVEFKRDISNYNLIYSTLRQKNVLSRQNIHILPAFKTNIIIRKYSGITKTSNLNTNSSLLDVNDELNNNNKFELDGTYRTNEFIFKIEFNYNKSNKKSVSSSSLTALDLIEYCYNLELINDCIAIFDYDTLNYLMRNTKNINKQIVSLSDGSFSNMILEFVKYLINFVYFLILNIFYSKGNGKKNK
jgi:hypothetical protein